MALPSYAKGFTYPYLSSQREISVVRCPASIGGFVYKAGVLGEDKMEPEFARAWAIKEEDDQVALISLATELTQHGHLALAALLRTCTFDEEMVQSPDNQLLVPGNVVRRLGRSAAGVKAQLISFGFNEDDIKDDFTVRARQLALRLDSKFPQLATPVVIPSQPAPNELLDN